MQARPYNETFQSSDEAVRYDHQLFADRSYGRILTEIEVGMVEDVLARSGSRPAAYLDFACGTGRILSRLAPRVGSATGADVSAAMLARAALQTPGATLLECDAAAHGGDIPGRYDLITAFRFFLHTEPPVRRAVMRSLADRLRDADSRLVFNIHSTPTSYRGPLALAAWGARRLGFAPRRVAVLSDRAVRALLRDAGLELVEVRGYGLFSRHILRFFSSRLTARLERRLTDTRLARAIGSHRLYVVKRRST